MNQKLVSLFGYILLLIAVVYLLINKFLIAENIVGITIQILSVALMIWARFTLGGRSFHLFSNPTEGELVTSGPYKYFRHPIYAAVFYFTWTGVIFHISLLTFAFGILASIGAGIRIYSEEKLLKEKYPNYSEYSEKTKRIIPFIL